MNNNNSTNSINNLSIIVESDMAKDKKAENIVCYIFEKDDGDYEDDEDVADFEDSGIIGIVILLGFSVTFLLLLYFFYKVMSNS